MDRSEDTVKNWSQAKIQKKVQIIDEGFSKEHHTASKKRDSGDSHHRTENSIIDLKAELDRLLAMQKEIDKNTNRASYQKTKMMNKKLSPELVRASYHSKKGI